MFAVSESIKKSVKECAVCEASMGAFDELLGDPNLQKDVDKLLKKVCPKLPAQDRDEVRRRRRNEIAYLLNVLIMKSQGTSTLFVVVFFCCLFFLVNSFM